MERIKNLKDNWFHDIHFGNIHARPFTNEEIELIAFAKEISESMFDETNISTSVVPVFDRTVMLEIASSFIYDKKTVRVFMDFRLNKMEVIMDSDDDSLAVVMRPLHVSNTNMKNEIKEFFNSTVKDQARSTFK